MWDQAMKNATKLHTREIGLCRLDDGTVTLYAETSDEVYFYPMEKRQDSYLLELTQYLIIKYEADTNKGYLTYLLEQGVDIQKALFDKKGQLLRERVIETVGYYLRGLDFPSADSI